MSLTALREQVTKLRDEAEHARFMSSGTPERAMECALNGVRMAAFSAVLALLDAEAQLDQCSAVHRGDRCGLLVGHSGDHRCEFQSGIVQWPALDAEAGADPRDPRLSCGNCPLKGARVVGSIHHGFERAGAAPPEPTHERLFPIMGGPAIPWSLIAPHERQAQLNHSQSLERLAARGGLGTWEAACVLRDRSPWPIPKSSEEAMRATFLKAVEEAARFKAAVSARPTPNGGVQP